MTNRNLALIGAALLLVGLFTPVVSVPFVGNVNLFNNGSNMIAIMLACLAALSAALTAKERLRDLIWSGLTASLILAYIFVRLQFALSQMRESIAEQMQQNPIMVLAQNAIGSIQLQWGWLVLVSGAGLLVYVGYIVRKADGSPRFALGDNVSRAVVGVSLLLLLCAPAWDLLLRSQVVPNIPTGPVAESHPNPPVISPIVGSSPSPTAEETTYVNQNLHLYDLDARYYDSILNGRVSGVRFKIQNNGTRTLNRVTVRVVFNDAQGSPIAEQEYSPVLVSEYNFEPNNGPLRPHYIWQQPPDRFFTADHVPSEWATGRATATITSIEFAPN
jgi:hypothetical protein